MNKIISFSVTSKIILEHEDGAKMPALQECRVSLEISKNLDRSMYFDRKGNYTGKDGAKVVTGALIQGLMANLAAAKMNGWWNEAEHMKYIIDELQRTFTHPIMSEPNVQDGLMDAPID